MLQKSFWLGGQPSPFSCWLAGFRGYCLNSSAIALMLYFLESNEATRKVRWISLLRSSLFILLLAGTSPVDASLKVIVDSIADGEDLNSDAVPDGLDGDTSVGQLTLREAVQLVDDGGTIHFSPNLEGQTILLQDPDSDGTALLVPSDKSFTVEGPQGSLTLSAATDETQLIRFRIFSTDSDLILRNLRLENGNVSTSSGGLIQVNGSGSIKLDRCQLFDSTAQSGGAIALHPSATALVQDSVLSGNSALQDGGAIWGGQSIQIVRSEISLNTAPSGQGGALFFEGENLRILNSTFSGNSARNHGILLYLSDQPAIDSVSVENSTFVLNKAQSINTTTEGDFQVSATTLPSLHLANSLFLENSFSGNSFFNDINFEGSFSGGGNLIQSSKTNGGSMTLQSQGVAAKLTGSGFADEYPKFHRLKPDSPLLDAGDSSLVSPENVFDQRMQPRVANAAVDIGAFELQNRPPEISIAAQSSEFLTPATEFIIPYSLTDDETPLGDLNLELIHDPTAFGVILDPDNREIRISNPSLSFEESLAMSLKVDDGDGNVSILDFQFLLKPQLLFVDSLADVEDTNGDSIPDGLDDDISAGQFTLREAFNRLSSEGGTIQFTDSLAGGTMTVDTLAGGKTAFSIPLGKPVSIIGPDEGITITTAANPFTGKEVRIFESFSDLSLKNLVLTAAYIEDDSGAAVKIHKDAPDGTFLLLENTVFSDNQVYGGNGAAIALLSDNGFFEAIRSEFRDNQSEINPSFPDPNQGRAAALEIGGEGNRVTILNSSFSAHEVELGPSVIYAPNASEITIRNTTFFENSGGDQVAFLGAASGEVELVHTAFVKNGDSPSMNAVFIEDGLNQVTLQNSLFIDNSGNDFAVENDSAPGLSIIKSSNWIQQDINPSKSLSADDLRLSENLFFSDPQLGRPAGLTITAADSLLIDNGNDGATIAADLQSDQLGFPHYALPGGGANLVDIGPVEYQGMPPVITDPFGSQVSFSPLEGDALTLEFDVSDDRTPFSSLGIAVSSSETSVLPLENISFTLQGSSTLSLRLAPVVGVVSGSSTVQVRIDDGLGGVSTRSVDFLLSTPAIVVDSSLDESDGDYSAGNLSLREAINLISPGGLITFAESLRGETIALSDLSTPEGIRIERPLTIDGEDRNIRLSTISDSQNGPFGDPDSDSGIGPFLRHFYIDTLSAEDTVTLKNFSLSNGVALSGGATGSDGGSILLQTGTLFLENMVFESNYAGRGGAVFLSSVDQPRFSVVRSVFKENTALLPESGATLEGVGGSVYASGNQEIRIENSTFLNNIASDYAGALFAGENAGLEILNSTLSGNRSTNGASAIFKQLAPSLGDEVAILQSTIVFNESDNDFLGRGAVHLEGPPPTFNLNLIEVHNSLFFGNAHGPSPSYRDLVLSPSLSPSLESSYFHSDQANPGDITPFKIGLNPQPAPNGSDFSELITHAIFSIEGSPLIDQGQDSRIPLGILTDQRGSQRTYDSPEFGFGQRVDIGAYEAGDRTPDIPGLQEVSVNPVEGPFQIELAIPGSSGSDFELLNLEFDSNGFGSVQGALNNEQSGMVLSLDVIPKPNVLKGSFSIFSAIQDPQGNAAGTEFRITYKTTSLVVDSLQDESDGNFEQGDLSLREAFREIADGGVITFHPQISGSQIHLTLGEIDVSDEREIIVTNSGNLITLQADNSERHLKTNGDLSITGIRFIGGDSDSFGGAIWATGPNSLSLQDSVFLNNKSDQDGSAIAMSGSGTNLVMDRVLVSGSELDAASSPSVGGAVYVGDGNRVTITNSTFLDNAGGAGKGASILNLTSSETHIRNNTFSNNTDSDHQLFLSGLGGSVSVVHNTFAFNESSRAALLLEDTDASSFFFINNLFVGNEGVSSPFANPSAGTFFEDGNFISSEDAPGADPVTLGFDSVARANANPNGDLLTHALLQGSPLIDSASSTSLPEDLLTDQRQFPRLAFIAPDPGAFEYQSAPPHLSLAEESFLFDSGNRTQSLRISVTDDRSTADELTVSVQFSKSGISLESLDAGQNQLSLNLLRDPDLLQGDNRVIVTAIDPTGGRSELSLDFLIEPLSLVVTEEGDEDDGDYTDGKLSLREAIRLVTDNGAVQFTAESPDQILLSGTLSVAKNIIVDGGTRNPLILTENGSYRHFILNGEISLKNLRLRDGSTDALAAGNPDGGSILVEGGKITLQGLEVSGNRSPNRGGAIAVSNGELMVEDSWIHSNTASANGGGIFINSGTLKVERTTLSENTANLGGAIFAGDQTTSLELINSTISSNEAAEFAALFLGGGDLTVLHSTIVQNTSSNRTPTDSVFQVNDPEGFSIQIDNSLFALNRILDTGIPLVERDLNTQVVFIGSGNYFHSQATEPLTLTAQDIGYDPALAANPDHLNLAPTHALLAEGSLIDSASPGPAVSLTQDQRGLSRIEGNAPDIGSYESRNLPPLLNAPPPLYRLDEDAGIFEAPLDSLFTESRDDDFMGFSLEVVDVENPALFASLPQILSSPDDAPLLRFLSAPDQFGEASFFLRATDNLSDESIDLQAKVEIQPVSDPTRLIKEIPDFSLKIGSSEILGFQDYFFDPDPGEILLNIDGFFPDFIGATVNGLDVMVNGLKVGPSPMVLFTFQSGDSFPPTRTELLVNVIPRNSPPRPLLNRPSREKIEAGGSQLTIPLANYFADDDGDRLDYQIIKLSRDDLGSLRLDPSGQSLIFTPSGSASGLLNVIVQATDPSGESIRVEINILSGEGKLTRRSVSLQNDWKFDTRIGLFWDAHLPWIYHFELGWLYIIPINEDTFFAYFPDFGWVYINPENYPYLYRASDQTYLYFYEGYQPKTFYNFSTGEREIYP